MRRCLTAAGVALAVAVLLVVPVAAGSGVALAGRRRDRLPDRPPRGLRRHQPVQRLERPVVGVLPPGYNFLTWYDREYKPVPDLARSWETSTDGRTWTFHISRG